MYKPRRIQLKYGMVMLKGFSLDIINQMEEHLLKFKPSIKTTVEILEPVKVEPKVFNDKAIGLTQINPSSFQLVVIGYDSITKEVLIEEVKPAGSFKEEAQSNYRLELFKRGLV